LHKFGHLFISHDLLRVLLPELAHQLRIKEIVHGPDLLKELLIVKEIYGRENALEAPAALVLIISVFK
jgi:hypothetical protein